MKKEFITIFKFAVVILMVALLGETGVSAQEKSMECSDGTFTVRPVTDVAFPRTADASDPAACAGGWVWEYVITSSDSKALSSLTKIHVYIPSLPPNVMEVLDHPDITRGIGPEAGNKDFGVGITNGVVATTTYLSGVSDGTHFSFCTDVNTVGIISIGFETSRNLTPCNAQISDAQGPLGGIIGPGFEPSGFIPIETDTRVNLGTTGGTICAKKHPTTGCIKYFYSCSDTNQNPEPLPSQNTPPVWFDGELVDMGDLENPLCREAIITRKGSPIQYWGVAGGEFYCLGVYDVNNTPYWFAPCYSHPGFPYFEDY